MIVVAADALIVVHRMQESLVMLLQLLLRLAAVEAVVLIQVAVASFTT